MPKLVLFAALGLVSPAAFAAGCSSGQVTTEAYRFGSPEKTAVLRHPPQIAGCERLPNSVLEPRDRLAPLLKS